MATSLFAEFFLSRFRTLIVASVILLWALSVNGIVRGLTYVFGLNQNDQNIVWWFAVGVTLVGIVSFFRRVHIREKAEILALQGASSDELDAVMKTRPYLRYAIVREIARRMFLERLQEMSNEGLDAFANSEPRALALINAERLRRRG